MKEPKLENKRIFLLASANENIVTQCRACIEQHISSTTIFTAVDGSETLFKVNNVLPHVAIIDSRLSKIDAFAITDQVIALAGSHSVSVILISALPESERYLEQIVTRQVQFIEDCSDIERLNLCLARALNRVSIDEHSTYSLKFLTAGEVLFNQGDPAQSVFYIKKGELEVTQKRGDRKVVLGRVAKQEFVGEMAHFNAEPRSATVQACEDCELIEIPSDTLDLVLFSKPSWAKALMATLSHRLKRSNERLSAAGQE